MNEEKLRAVWKELSSEDKPLKTPIKTSKGKTLRRMSDNFIDELTYFQKNTPPIYSLDGRKQQTAEAEAYEAIVKNCESLILALNKISHYERQHLSFLAPYYINGNKKYLPVIEDPLIYIESMKEIAEHYRPQLKHHGTVSKFSRQLHLLKNFIKRFPQAKDITRAQFKRLAIALWPDYSGEEGKNIETAIDKIGYKNLP